MQSTNFQPLASRWPQLYEYACFAEQYVYTDPNTAIVKLRCFVEILVGALYRDLGLLCEEGDGFFEKLKSAAFQKIIDTPILGKIHAIRILGNKAAHGRGVNSDDALALIREAYLIGKWFYKTCSGNISGSYPDFETPVHPDERLQTLSAAHELLAEQLNAAKAELGRLEVSEKYAQQQIAALNHSLDEVKLQAFKNASTQAANSFDLEVDNTHRLISIHDAFAQYTLNEGQAELVKRLEQFLASKENSVFQLRGYAGTGKTFITKGLTEYFRAIGRNFVLAAPTGKASKVIAKKTQSPAYTIHKTIYSFKDITEYREDDLDGSETYKLYAQLAVNEMSADTVFIVDEASMISDVYNENEFFRFGSGYLLRDFFKYVNLDHNDHSKKVIFIGDDAQLPPVGMNFSPALDAGYLFREHNVRPVSFELNEVVRQKSDSGVIQNSIKLRKALGNNSFGHLVVDLNYPDLKKVEYCDLLPRYLESCQGKINAEAIVIAHSNSDVAAYNRHIREHFFPGCTEVTAGDKVMAVNNSNAYGFFISNGDFGLVRSVSAEVEQRIITLKHKNQDSGETEEIKVPLKFREATIGFKDLDETPRFFKAMIFEDLLYSEHPGLSSDQNKAMYVDFCIRHHPYLKSGSLAFKQTLKSDPYFNALRLKFGYAITCHKAQGSEWNHVFVKCKTHQSQLSADYFRWFYTAITRTKDKLYLLDPPHIEVGATMSRVRNSGIELLASNQQSIPNPQLPDRTTDNGPLNQFGIPESAGFLLAILDHVRSLTAGQAIEIDDIIHNQYQEAYVFKRDNDFARISITYNGKNKVTNVVDDQTTELGRYVADLLTPLKGKVVVVKAAMPAPFQFEKAFLNDFHHRISLLVADQGIFIQAVTSQQWNQRYTFVRDNEVAVYDIYYNGKDRFTKPVPVIPACSPGSLVVDVEMLLIEGMSA